MSNVRPMKESVTPPIRTARVDVDPKAIQDGGVFELSAQDRKPV